MIDTLFTWLGEVYEWLKSNWATILLFLMPLLGAFGSVVTLVYQFGTGAYSNIYQVIMLATSNTPYLNFIQDAGGPPLLLWCLQFISINGLTTGIFSIMTVETTIVGLRAGIALYKLVPFKMT